MAGSVNKVILIGNVGKDPEIRTTQSGSRLCNLSIATSESWKDKATGERKENTQWHRVVIFNDALVGIAERFLKKGSKVYLEGQLETRKWTDTEGKDNYSTEVVLRPYRGELTLLDARQGGSEGGYGGGGYAGNSNEQQPSYNAPSSGGASFADDLDDEIPF
jgi:single-strand DNA-binding protein